MFVNELLFGLSKLSDNIEGNDTFHQRRVAIIAFEIGKKLKLDKFGLNLLVQSALIHDIALLNDTSKVETFRQIIYEDFKDLQRHAIISGRVARFFNLHLDVTTAINLHHTKIESNYSVLGSILFLADNIEVAYRSLTNPYAFDELYDFLAAKKNLFDEKILSAFKDVAKRECFWFSLMDENVDYKVRDILNLLDRDKADDRLKKCICYLIGFASDSIAPFFDGYSVLIKNLAISVAYKLGLDVDMILKAALLSHIGNIVLPYDVFKKEYIDEDDYSLIKSHTYEGRRWVKLLGFDELSDLVLYHHENLAKTGYPCKIVPKKEQQVLAIASFVAAMMQDRPNRAALSKSEIAAVLNSYKDNGLYDENIVSAFFDVDLDKVQKTEDEYYEAVKKLFL